MFDNREAEFKRAVFVDMVRTVLIVSARSKNCTAYSLLNVAHEIGRLNAVSLRIPADLSASEAAGEYMTSQWDEFEDFRTEPGYVHPAWTGETSREEVLTRIASSEPEDLIDGVWQAVNPDWEGIPGDNSIALKAVAYIRDHGQATTSALAAVIPNANRQLIHRFLKAYESEDNLVSLRGAGRGAMWVATRKLLDSKPKTRVPTQSGLKRKDQQKEKAWSFEEKEADLALALSRKFPELSDVLSFLRRHRKASISQINTAAPHLDRYRMRRLLEKLSSYDLVAMKGAKRGAMWFPTKKLLEKSV